MIKSYLITICIVVSFMLGLTIGFYTPKFRGNSCEIKKCPQDLTISLQECERTAIMLNNSLRMEERKFEICAEQYETLIERVNNIFRNKKD